MVSGSRRGLPGAQDLSGQQVIVPLLPSLSFLELDLRRIIRRTEEDQATDERKFRETNRWRNESEPWGLAW
jgi:hypothetical protein